MADNLDRPHFAVSTLPTELIIGILRCALPEEMNSKGRKQFQILRMVCSLWRRICFSTPSFWTSIALPRDEFNGGDNKTSGTSSLQSWFSRSGTSHTLSLSITYSPSFIPE